jgi:hypothetical protein
MIAQLTRQMMEFNEVQFRSVVKAVSITEYKLQGWPLIAPSQIRPPPSALRACAVAISTTFVLCVMLLRLPISLALHPDIAWAWLMQ